MLFDSHGERAENASYFSSKHSIIIREKSRSLAFPARASHFGVETCLSVALKSDYWEIKACVRKKRVEGRNAERERERGTFKNKMKMIHLPSFLCSRSLEKVMKITMRDHHEESCNLGWTFNMGQVNIRSIPPFILPFLKIWQEKSLSLFLGKKPVGVCAFSLRS